MNISENDILNGCSIRKVIAKYKKHPNIEKDYESIG